MLLNQVLLPPLRTIFLMSNSVLSRLSRKENQEHRTSNKSLKFKSHRVLRPADPVNSVVLDQRQISQQLSQQFSLIESMIQDYKMRMEVEAIPRKSRSTFQQDIFNLEEIIRFKDQQITKINQEIQQLKMMKSRQIHRSTLQNTPSHAFTLAEELKDQRLELKQLMQFHTQKMNNQKILYLAIKRLETIYQKKYPNRDTNYHNFKEKELQNRRQEDSKKKKREVRGPSIRQRIENHSESSTLQKSQTDQKSESRSMKELQDKKRIAQMAIKNSKKKHQTEIAELNAKLQFLRDENALLNQKIRETELERVHLMEKLHLNVQNRIRSKERHYTAFSSPQ